MTNPNFDLDSARERYDGYFAKCDPPPEYNYQHVKCYHPVWADIVVRKGVDISQLGEDIEGDCVFVSRDEIVYPTENKSYDLLIGDPFSIKNATYIRYFSNLSALWFQWEKNGVTFWTDVEFTKFTEAL